MGCLLQSQEDGKTDTTILLLIEQASDSALQEDGKTDTTILLLIEQASDSALRAVNDSDPLVRDAALDLLRSLPARTIEEIALVRRIVEGIPDQHSRKMCAYSLRDASPVDDQAWQELEQGHTSTVPEVREAVAEAMKRRMK